FSPWPSSGRSSGDGPVSSSPLRSPSVSSSWGDTFPSCPSYTHSSAPTPNSPPMLCFTNVFSPWTSRRHTPSPTASSKASPSSSSTTPFSSPPSASSNRTATREPSTTSAATSSSSPSASSSPSSPTTTRKNYPTAPVLPSLSRC